MKHNYRNKQGQFAKRPVGCPETITSEKKLHEHVLSPIKLHACPICDEFKKIRNPNPYAQYSIPMGAEFEGDVRQFLDSEPHNGHPTFLNIQNDSQHRLRLCQGIFPYKQKYPSLPEPVNKYLVNVYDHADGKFKVLTCGMTLARQIYNEMQAGMSCRETKTIFQRVMSFIKQFVFRMEKQSKPFDICIERSTYDGSNDPRKTKYNVKRITVDA